MDKKTTKWLLLLFALLLPSLGWAQDQTVKRNGLIFTFDTDHFELTGYDAEGFYGYLSIPYNIRNSDYSWYRVTKLKAGALEGITNVTSVNISANLDEFPEDFFKGIGSQDNPIDASFSWYYLPQYGGTFVDQVYQLAGGYFNVIMNEWSTGFEYRYTLVDDYEFWLTDITAYEDYDQYQLYLYTQYDDAQLTKVLPEVTAKWKEKASKITQVTISGSNKPDIDADAFAGIGTANAPADIQMSLEDFTNWGGNTSTGELLGGYFSIMRSEWGGNGIYYITYRLTGNGYTVSDPIQYYEGYDQYTLNLNTQFEDWNENTQEYDYTYVSEIKADAFKNIRENISNMNFTQIFIYGDGENTTTKIEDGAFEGFGAETPIYLSIDPALFTNLGGTFENGVALLKGGKFKIATDWYYINSGLYARYYWENDGYAMAELNKYEGYENMAFRIRSDVNGQPITKVCSSINEVLQSAKITSMEIQGGNLKEIEDGAFKGIGTDDNPVNLTISTSLLKKFGKVTAKGNYEIAGGYFLAGKISNNGDFTLTYVPNENNGYTLARVVANNESQNNPKTLSISSYFSEYDENGNRVQIPVNGIAENACEGIGSAEAPVWLSMYRTLAQTLGAKTENGLTTLAGGVFELGYTIDNTYYNGTTILYKLEDDGKSYTVKGYIQDLSDYFKQQHPEGYKIVISSSISDYNGNEWVESIPVTKIALDAFKDIKDVYAVTLGTDLSEIPDNAFSGIGTAQKPATLDINIALLKKLNPQSENGVTLLGGGYFDVAYINSNNGVYTTYSYVDDHYELSSVTPRYSYEEYTIRVSSQPNRYWDEETQRYIYPQVTKIRANAFSNLADKITSVNIEGSSIDIEDGAFNGIGTVKKPASIAASNAILKNAIGEKLAEGVYNVKGGIFALNALTIKAQKNPDNRNYAITYAYVDETMVFDYQTEEYEEGQWRPKPDSYALMEAPAEGSDYYTYTFLSANRISSLTLSILDENNVPDYEIYYNKVELNITTDTIFVWKEDKGRLWLKDAPEEYDFWLAGRFVTAANAKDILADDKANAGKAKYDAKTNTLTLDGVDIQYYGYVFENNNYDGLTIVLKGQNTFRPNEGETYAYVRMDNDGPLTISGTGTLNLIGSNKDVTETNGNWGRIISYNDFTIKGGATLKATRIWYFNNNSYKLTIDGGTLSITDIKGDYVLRARELILGEGTKMITPKDGSLIGRYLCDAEGNYAKTVIISSDGGDANNDGVVDAADIMEIVNHIMGQESENYNPAGADVNKDGVVNAADIVMIVNMIIPVETGEE